LSFYTENPPEARASLADDGAFSVPVALAGTPVALMGIPVALTGTIFALTGTPEGAAGTEIGASPANGSTFLADDGVNKPMFRTIR
jgi:hypothetical protein